ncbi:hypothetical protein FOXB_10701, partial [Fusarium oxysporum f. sp. conglutinans Fo5176]
TENFCHFDGDGGIGSYGRDGEITRVLGAEPQRLRLMHDDKCAGLMIAEIPESITYAKPELVSPIKHLIHSAVTLSTTITSNAMAEAETPLTPPAPDDGSYEGSKFSVLN